jgi:hypothetical protein
VTHRPCPLCGGRLPTYRLEPPSGQAWDSFLNAWFRSWGTAPVMSRDLLALAQAHRVELPRNSAVALGHMLGQLAKGNSGPAGYIVRQHTMAKGARNPSKWRLIPAQSGVTPRSTYALTETNSAHHRLAEEETAP